MPALLLPEEVAEHYRVTVATVVKWARTGRIQSINVGTAKKAMYRIPASALQGFGGKPLVLPPKPKKSYVR